MGRAVLWMSILAVALLAPVGCEEPPQADLSNPKAAAITFSKALESGDLATARMASNASGFEGDLLEAMADSSSGMARLTAVASANLGEEARKIAQQHATISMTRMLTDAEVTHQGDRATVKSRDGGSVQLQKFEGNWRVDVGALGKGQDLTQVATFLRAAGLAARQVSDDIDAGVVTTVAEAQDAMLGRVLANLPPRLRHQLLRRRTTAAPATTPATTPGP